MLWSFWFISFGRPANLTHQLSNLFHLFDLFPLVSSEYRMICGIKENLVSFFKLSANTKTKLPPGLLKQLHICSNTPMKPPIIFARCYKRILGCQSCVDKWYRREGEESTTRSCPLCRGERAYAETSIIKGMDDFFLSIAPMISEEDSDVFRVESSEEDFPAVNL